MTARITVDADAKALFIQLSDAEVLETVELAGNVYLDLDANGEPVGIEVLNADPALPALVLALPEAGSLGDLLRPRAA